MKKIKSNKLVFTKKSIIELTNVELQKINGGSTAPYEYPTTSVYTGNALCGAVLNAMEN